MTTAAPSPSSDLDTFHAEGFTVHRRHPALKAVGPARTYAALKLAPYFAREVFNPEVVIVEGMFERLGAAAAVTPGKVVLLDPVCVSWSRAVLAWVLIHEVEHPYRRHRDRGNALRVAETDAEAWRMATDAEINDDHPEAEWPYEVVTPKALGLKAGLTAEGYFSALAKRTRKGGGRGRSGGASAAPRSSEKEGEVRNSGARGPHGESPSASEESGESPRPSARGPHGGACCGDGGGESSPKFRALNAAVDAVWGKDAATVAAERRDTAREVRAAAAKRPGSVPAGLLRAAEEILAVPDPGWRSLTSAVLSHALRHTRSGRHATYQRRSVLQASVGFGPTAPVLSSTRKPLPEVWFVLDASGSMGPHELGVGVAYATSLLRHLGRSLRFLTVDVAVHARVQVSAPSAFVQHLRGGGGTNFCGLFAEIEALPRSRRPDVVVLATDGYAVVPDHAPAGVPVVWLLIGAGAPRPAPWGSAVWVSEP